MRNLFRIPMQFFAEPGAQAGDLSSSPAASEDEKNTADPEPKPTPDPAPAPNPAPDTPTAEELAAFRKWQESQQTEAEKHAAALGKAEKAKLAAEERAAAAELKLTALSKGVTAQAVEGTSQKELYSQPIEFVRNGAWDKSKATIIGGDWKYSLFGLKQGIKYEVLKEATLQNTVGADGKPIALAEQDMIAIKGTMRVGYLCVKGDAFAAIVPEEAETAETTGDEEDAA